MKLYNDKNILNTAQRMQQVMSSPAKGTVSSWTFGKIEQLTPQQSDTKAKKFWKVVAQKLLVVALPLFVSLDILFHSFKAIAYGITATTNGKHALRHAKGLAKAVALFAYSIPGLFAGLISEPTKVYRTPDSWKQVMQKRLTTQLQKAMDSSKKEGQEAFKEALRHVLYETVLNPEIRKGLKPIITALKENIDWEGEAAIAEARKNMETFARIIASATAAKAPLHKENQIALNNIFQTLMEQTLTLPYPEPRHQIESQIVHARMERSSLINNVNQHLQSEGSDPERSLSYYYLLQFKDSVRASTEEFLAHERFSDSQVKGEFVVFLQKFADLEGVTDFEKGIIWEHLVACSTRDQYEAGVEHLSRAIASKNPAEKILAIYNALEENSTLQLEDDTVGALL